jgi:DNA-binding CsgD family transcriptional regulator
MELFERDREFSTLNDLLAHTHNGNGQIALITAAVGNGKTALLRKFGEVVRREGCVTLNASCAGAEQKVPLAALTQLFDSPSLEAKDAQRAAELLSEWHRPAGGSAAERPRAQVMLELVRIILDLSRTKTVVLSVDDVHHSDPESLQYLQHILRRVHASRVLAILTERACHNGPHSPLQTELLRQPNVHPLWLPPLSLQGVAEMVSVTAGHAFAQELGTEYHALTGGNCSLVQALLRDRAGEDPAGRTDGPVPGSAFEQSVVRCLASEEPVLRGTARGLALLGDCATQEVLALLLRLPRETVARALHALTVTGILDGTRFRHPATAAAVLGDMPLGERDALHRRAARVLYEMNAPAPAVAAHLLSTGSADEPWMIESLISAADTLFQQGRSVTARTYLELGHRFSTDDRQRASIGIALAEIECRISPQAVSRRVPQLLAALRAGLVPGRKALRLCESLLWNGQVDAFDELPDLLGKLMAVAEPDLDTEAEVIRRLLSSTFPQLAEKVSDVLGRPARQPLTTSALATNNRLKALAAYDTALARGADPGAVADAKQILNGSALSEATFPPITMALWTLVHADRLSEAEVWSDRLLGEAESRGTAGWLASFAWTRASVALRQGNLPSAERHAQAAIGHLPLDAWGVRVGGPYATLLHTVTGMGKHADATGILNRPVPEAMFGTPFGLVYLHARGRCCLARRQYQAALNDFVACGELMASWRLDRPALVPWRSSAAEVWLHLGHTNKAGRLVEEQLALLTPHDSTVRGASLRLLGLTRRPQERVVLLNKAAEMFQRLGRKLELAEVQADLGEAYQALGDSEQQRVAVRRARHLTQECQAKGAHCVALLDVSRDSAVQRHDGMDDKLAHLSDAERRVSELAALGRTNREISSSLCITISTVEQHLTRVYRKLSIQRRQDLPAGLRPRIATRESEQYGAGRIPLARRHA